MGIESKVIIQIDLSEDLQLYNWLKSHAKFDCLK
jgi:hypothetical protein